MALNIFKLFVEFFQKYFVDYKLNVSGSFNASYRSDFVFYIGTIGQTTNVLMNVANIFARFGGFNSTRLPHVYQIKVI